MCNEETVIVVKNFDPNNPTPSKWNFLEQIINSAREGGFFVEFDDETLDKLEPHFNALYPKRVLKDLNEETKELEEMFSKWSEEDKKKKNIPTDTEGFRQMAERNRRNGRCIFLYFFRFEEIKEKILKEMVEEAKKYHNLKVREQYLLEKLEKNKRIYSSLNSR